MSPDRDLVWLGGMMPEHVRYLHASAVTTQQLMGDHEACYRRSRLLCGVARVELERSAVVRARLDDAIDDVRGHPPLIPCAARSAGERVTLGPHLPLAAARRWPAGEYAHRRNAAFFL